MVDAIRKNGKLEKRLYELIVLITVRHAASAYAWAVHDPLGRAAGLSGEVVDAIKAKRTPPFQKTDEKVIYNAVTELLTTNKISDAAYQALVNQFGLSDSIEIITCVGLYCMIGRRHQCFRGADTERRKAVLTRTQRMFVKLSITGQVTLEDRDNFRAFKLVVEGEPGRLDQAKRALTNIAEIEDQTHAWIFEQGVAAAARGCGRRHVAGQSRHDDREGQAARLDR